MVLHVERGPDGRRALAEIAVLRRGADGLVRAVPAWHVGTGVGAGMAELLALLGPDS